MHRRLEDLQLQLQAASEPSEPRHEPSLPPVIQPIGSRTPPPPSPPPNLPPTVAPLPHVPSAAPAAADTSNNHVGAASKPPYPVAPPAPLLGSPGAQAARPSAPPFAAAAEPAEAPASALHLPPIVAPMAGPNAAAAVPAGDLEGRSRALLLDAERRAQQLVGDAEARVASLRSQIDRLLRVRDGLLSSARSVLHEYRAMIEAIEAEEQGGALASAADLLPLSVPGPAAAPTTTALPPSIPLSATPVPVASAPAASHPATGPVHALPSHHAAGRLRIEAGPFGDIAELAAFEQSLARLPGAEDVYVQGFSGDRAIVDVALEREIDVLGELRRLLGHGFTVDAADSSRVSLVLHPNEKV